MQEGQNRKANKRKIGAKYEEIAAGYLVSKGYKIIKRNYVNPCGEIDILAQKDSAWIFCEVKYRSSNDYGGPFAAVDKKKQKRISKAALYFYARHGYAEGVPCRFDVIAIYGDGAIEHMENAFSFQR